MPPTKAPTRSFQVKVVPPEEGEGGVRIHVRLNPARSGLSTKRHSVHGERVMSTHFARRFATQMLLASLGLRFPATEDIPQEIADDLAHHALNLLDTWESPDAR